MIVSTALFKLVEALSFKTSTLLWVCQRTPSDFEVMVFLADFTLMHFSTVLSELTELSLEIETNFMFNSN